jgi:hypothetical protein
MGDKVGLDAAGLPQKIGQAAEELVVRDLRERSLLLHERSLDPTLDRPGPFLCDPCPSAEPQRWFRVRSAAALTPRPNGLRALDADELFDDDALALPADGAGKERHAV